MIPKKIKLKISLLSLLFCAITLCGCEKQQTNVNTCNLQNAGVNTSVSDKSKEVNLEKKLFEAIENYDDLTVKNLISQGVNVNAKENEVRDMGEGLYTNGSAVEYAGHLFFIGIDSWYRKDKYFIASKNILYDLINAGASLDNCEYVVRQIVEFGEDPSLVELLLNKGIDFKQYDGILYNAARSSNEDIFKSILKFDNDINYISEFQNRTVLMEGVGNKVIAKTLLNMGSDINQKDRYGETAFMSAVYRGNEDVVKLLIKYNADINIKANLDHSCFMRGENALMKAVLGGHKNMITLLLDHGIDIEEKDSWGQTALHMAAIGWGYRKAANPEITEFLLKNGANVNAKDNCGQTPLICHIASTNNTEICVETILTLVKFGADLTIKDYAGKTAIDYLNEIEICDYSRDLRVTKAFDILKHPQKAIHLAAAPNFDGLKKRFGYHACHSCTYFGDHNLERKLPKNIILRKNIFMLNDKESIYYPEITELNNKEEEYKLNQKLKQSFIKQQKSNKYIKDDNQYHTCDFNCWQVGDLITIIKKEFTISDKAQNGEEKQKSFFINTTSGQLYTTKDLLKKDLDVASIIGKHIYENQINENKNDPIDYANFTFKNNFIITRKGIEIYLDKNNSKLYGKRVFKINYKDLDNIIDKDGDMYKAIAVAFD